MPHSYPPPTALPHEVEQVISLYRDKYGVELPFHEAKKLLEGVTQFIYLTEVEDALRPLREEAKGQEN